LAEGAREAVVEIIDTKQPEHGDFACNFAMAAAKKAGMQPRQIGEMLREELLQSEPFQEIEVAGPGFINFRLKPEFVAAYVPGILSQGEAFARIQAARPLRLNVEFVSVNPNGPITVGSGRGAAFGDTLCRVFEAAGHIVNREYYINDGVNSEQMRRFALSIKAHVLQMLDSVDLPEDTQYRGEYVKRVAKNLLAEQSVMQLGTNFELWQYAFSEICSASGRTDLLPSAAEIYGGGPACRERLQWLLQSDTPINNLARNVEDILDLTAAVFVAAHGFMPVSWSQVQFEQRYRELVLPTFLIAEALRAGEEVNVVDTIRMMDDFTNVARQLFAKSMEIHGTTPDRLADPLEDEVAQLVSTQIGEQARTLPASWYQQIGQQIMLQDQAHSLGLFGVRFDTWFSEQSLHEAGVVESLLDELIAKGVADAEA
jgi:arginyl-tRNA synthetase